MHECCDSCNVDYNFTKENCTLNLFIENPECNHVEATCPNCGNVERMYTTADSFLHIMQAIGAGLSLHPRATEELQERANITWQSATPEVEEQTLPDLPSQVRRELYDDLRNWKGAL